MLSASVQGKDGRYLLVIGLSFANLEHLRTHPNDAFLKIDGTRINIPLDVMLFSGESEADLAAIIVKADGIGPDTKVTVTHKLKN
jgi:hypothetical protein